jgi:GDPmannose 4,6-dehydratase
MTTALILGVTGQDGVYLAELLAEHGYDIVGVTRDLAAAATKLPATLRARVELEHWNMLDARRIADVFAKHRPAAAYNCAARSTGVGMYDDPAAMALINGVAVTHVLEAIRTQSAATRFCQASSSEMFGEPTQSPQSETTPFNPRSPYGAAKLYAHSMVDIYRRTHGVFACSAILFNHESPRRPLHYVTKKVSRAAAAIKLGLADELKLGNMTAVRDWGFAGDSVRAMWSMLQQPKAEDYVVATGATHSVETLCQTAFGYVGLDYRKYVVTDADAYRPDERVALVGDPRKAKAQLGWEPSVGFEALVHMMVDADLESLRGAGAPQGIR